MAHSLLVACAVVNDTAELHGGNDGILHELWYPG
jgi:hypothetical protein